MGNKKDKNFCVNETPKDGINCPFCGEKDFDKVGLKYHLENYCQEYKDTLTIEEERTLRKIKLQGE